MPVVASCVKSVLACVAVTQSEQSERVVDPITAVIARRLAERRQAIGINQTELAARMTERGSAWSRTTVQKLESGKRGAVSAQELLALALVLDVPPVMLIADPRQPGTVPVADGLDVDQWGALMWLVGTGTIDKTNSGRNFTDAAWLIGAGFTLVEALGDLHQVDRAQELTDARHRNALERIRTALTRIEAQGAAPPQLAEPVLKRAAELDVDLPGVEG